MGFITGIVGPFLMQQTGMESIGGPLEVLLLKETVEVVTTQLQQRVFKVMRFLNIQTVQMIGLKQKSLELRRFMLLTQIHRFMVNGFEMGESLRRKLRPLM
ncbi:hypothetical protein C7121_29355 [Paenibacillus glucanolyticus]|nr:hypothetical protein A3958_15710 [Paenibacillus glucanolyticus]AVV59938.1 hypothetical protein C7121_29355 [Paenibacillus glucanolyticus]ETT35565.1 hypothetical protein C169_16194 [Paenibacillus sp. FSL R5-808]